MMLTPQDLRVQERILLSIHKGCTIEEAREKESKLCGCFLTRGTVLLPDFVMSDDGTIYEDGCEIKNEEIIGLSPTLSRVLHALGYNYNWYMENANNNETKRLIILDKDYIRIDDTERKLLNDDGTEACLRDQEQSTKDAIALLLGYKGGT